jgi:acetoacetyl-CoA synthetase
MTSNCVQQNRILEDGPFPEVPNWFPGARLNYAENILHRKDDSIAIVAAGEDGIVTNYTFRELYHLVQELAGALRVNGLQVGDRVAGVQSSILGSGSWMLTDNCSKLS